MDAMEKEYWVYIISNKDRTSLYIGVTNNLERRMREHREGTFEGHSRKYNLNRLMYYESFGYINDAISREKQLKKWERAWKNNLIMSMNKNWEDLSANWFDGS